MSTYIALLRKDDDSDFGVDFPDFPGCVTAGSTLDEARTMAAEALSLHLDGMLADGDPHPEASSLDAVMSDPHNRAAIVFLVSIPDKGSPAVRVNITLPAGDLTAIDAYAEAHGMTRSGLLALAVRRLIGPKAA
jgi:predicted RNase H-like HicB family nuclease